MLVCEGVGVFTSMPGGTAGDSTLVPAIWGREFFLLLSFTLRKIRWDDKGE